jgi:hypothetical protein
LTANPPGPQQGHAPAVAVPAILGGQLDHLLHQSRLIAGDGRHTPLGRARLAKPLAGPALRDAVTAEHPPEGVDGGAPLSRDQDIPEAASSMIALSGSA